MPINQMVKQNRNPNLKEKEPYQQPSTRYLRLKLSNSNNNRTHWAIGDGKIGSEIREEIVLVVGLKQQQQTSPHPWSQSTSTLAMARSNQRLPWLGLESSTCCRNAAPQGILVLYFSLFFSISSYVFVVL